MTNLPKISVVIPSYNKVKFIGETLQSIVDQKYPNLEVIIQDGGSTDGTLDIVKKYAKKYPRIFSFESKIDKGQTDAINKGFKKATGDIFAFINADDVYEKGALLVVGEYFAKHPDTLWLAGQGRVINEKGQEVARWVTLYKNFLLSSNNYQLLLVLNYLIQPSVFIKRKAYEEFGPFVGSGKFVMEYDLWLRIGKTKMPIVLTKPISCFRLTIEGFSLSMFMKILQEDYKMAGKYTNNCIVLGLHKLHNTGRICVAYLDKLLK